MLCFLFKKIWNCFMEIENCPRLELRGCVFVCMCTPPPCTECYQELVYSLAGCCCSLHSHQFFLQLWASFSRTEFLTSESSKFQVRLAAKFHSRGKGVFNNRTFSSSCTLAHSNLKMLMNLAAGEAGIAQRRSLIIPHLTVPCCLLANICEVGSGGKGRTEGSTIL